jgi:methylamine utilization protein MauE
MSVIGLDLLAPPFFASAGLLVLSGSAKLRATGPAGRALAAVRFPSGSWSVRGIGTLEIGIGMWCLAAPSHSSSLALAALFAGFAMLLALQMKVRAPGASCGCLGTRETPASLLHIALDLVATAAAVLAAASHPRGILAHAARLPLRGAPFLLGTVLIGYLGYLAVAYLPEVFWSYRRTAAASARSLPPRQFALTRAADR